MIEALTFIKEPIPFGDFCKVYPPSVRKVITNKNFSLYEKTLTLTNEDVQDLLKEKNIPPEECPTALRFLLENARYSKEFEILLYDSFDFFIKEKVLLKYKECEIRLASRPNEKFITQDNFFDFSNIIRVCLGDKKQEPPIPVDPNEDPRIRKIKERARQRDRIKAKQHSRKGISLKTTLVAICCMGLGLNPLNIGEMSYGAIGSIMSMMQDKEKYDIDIRSLLAGADSKKVKPKYWIRNTND